MVEEKVALTTKPQDLVEVLERIHGGKGAHDDLPGGEAFYSGESGRSGSVKQWWIYAHTELPVQLSQPQETWCAGTSIGEPPDPEEDNEKDLL